MLDQFWDITGCFWQVGVVITLLLSCITYLTFLWVSGVDQMLTETIMGTLFHQVYWLWYFFPLFFLCLTVAFSIKAYASYRTH